MARSNQKTLKPAAVLLCSSIVIGTDSVGQHHWTVALLALGLALLVIGWYLIIYKLHPCCGYAPTTLDGICRNVERGGLVRGCHLHRYWRIKRFAGTWVRWRYGEISDNSALRPGVHREPARSPGGNAPTILDVRPVGVDTRPDPKAERVQYWCALVTIVTGVLSTLIAAIGLVVQLHSAP
jgi:hypothetical protein